MRVAYVTIQEERGHAETLGPQPRADAEQDWDWVVTELRREGNTLARWLLEREGDVLRRAEFEGPRGRVTVSLIGDGSR